VLLKTLSRRTVLHAHRCLSRVLADAVALGTLGRNVAAVRRPPAVEDDELVILTEEQVQAVLTSLMGEITATLMLCRAALMVVAPSDPGGLSVTIVWSAGLAGFLLAFLLLGVSEMHLVLWKIEGHLRKDTDDKVRR
jgi:hypothetical protein